MLTLFTSGSTDQPKQVSHSWEEINECARASIREIGLTKEDRVLDVFPANTIAHYTITSYPAQLAGSKLLSANFNPYSYVENFKKFQPTVISLIPKHLELLKQTKGFDTLDMSSVRYMVTGSNKIEQEFIDTFKTKGVQTVANWYGMTEQPPPVFLGYNTESFDFTPKKGYSVDFADDGECIINGFATGDIFDVANKKFLRRKQESTGNTWKTI